MGSLKWVTCFILLVFPQKLKTCKVGVPGTKSWRSWSWIVRQLRYWWVLLPNTTPPGWNFCLLALVSLSQCHVWLGGPQGSFFLCAVFGTKNCSNCPYTCLTKSQILQTLFAGDLWTTRLVFQRCRGCKQNGNPHATTLGRDGCGPPVCGLLCLLQNNRKSFRGSHLSNTTCLTHVFFKCGDWCSKLRWSLTRRNTHKTNEAVLDK